MSDAYTPGINTGDRIERAEFDRIAAASDALEARIASIESLPNAAYGGIRMEIGNTHGISLTSTPKEVTAWDTASPAKNITQDLAAGSLTVGKDGVYDFSAVIGLSGVDGQTTYTMDVYLNGLASGGVPADAPKKDATTVVMSAMSMPVSLTAGDYISLFLSADSNGTVEIERCVMKLFRVG